MSKRPRDDPGDGPIKKHKQGQHDYGHNRSHGREAQLTKPVGEKQQSDNIYEAARKQLPPSKQTQANVPPYIPFEVAQGLPPLPYISPALANAPFIHKSEAGYDRNSTISDMSYERLEFLGDAYIELIASRLIFDHLPHLTAGAQSQVRELLVKNETLAEYASAYGFEERLNLLGMRKLIRDARNRGNKGLYKILGDSFEAFVAAAVLSDGEHGFAVVEKWLTTLWAPKLLEGLKTHKYSAVSVNHDGDSDPLQVFDPTAKATLQNKIMGNGIKLHYEPYQDSVELKGDQLGQNRHYIAVYLTGYGYTRQLLGKGEGKNKVEAGNWAAVQAIHGESKAIVQKCAEELIAQREARKKIPSEQ